jgi:hypothetical protein
MNIVDSLQNPQLLGALPAFKDLTTWRAWLSFLKAVHGLTMDADDLATFRKHTNRQTPRPGGYPESVAIVGVQSGKTQIAALEASHAVLSAKPNTHAVMVGQDHRGAMRSLLQYAREPFETIDAWRAEVLRTTADTLTLRNGASLSAYPCRPSAVRGIRACVVIVDELAFFVSSEGRAVDTEMLRVARGRVATTQGKVIILSSPYAASGALWSLHRQFYGKEDASTLIWQADAKSMNPTLSSNYLSKMAEDDPEAYRSEVLGEFRQGIATLFDPDCIDAVVSEGVRERAFEPRQRYVSGCDPSSGSGKDAFTLSIAHQDGERAVLDVCRAWSPPFNPSNAIAEAARLLKAYGITETTGDRYAAGFVLEGFRAHGIQYRQSERDRSQIYLDTVPVVNSGGCVLLDDPELLRELRGLERRRGTAGRDRVDHRPGSHDDRANSASAAITLVTCGPKPVRQVELLVG